MALDDSKLDTMPAGSSLFVLGVDANGNPVLDNALNSLRTLLGTQVIGAETPAAGNNNISSGGTFVQNEAAAVDSLVERITFHSAVAGTLTFGIFTKATNTFTRIATKVVSTAIGVNTVTWGASIQAGEYLGVTVGTTGALTYTNPGADADGWFSGTLSAEAFTDASASTGAPVQFKFDLIAVAPQVGTRFAGKRIAFFGDSMTDGDTWPGDLCTYLGATLVDNYAAGGATLATMLTQFDSSTFDNVDIALFTGCTNDYHNARTLGTSADTSATDTFHGDVKELIETALGYKPDLRLVFATSPQRTLAPSVGGGPTLLEYVDAFIEEAGLYGCPIKDLYRESGLNSVNMATLTSDNLHPTSGGADFVFLAPLKAFFDGVVAS